MHLPACLHIHTTTLSGTAAGIGKGEVFRHIIIVVFQFEARGAARRDVRPCTRRCGYLAKVLLRPCAALLCQGGRKEGKECQYRYLFHNLYLIILTDIV